MDNHRQLRPIETRRGPEIRVDHRDYVDFSSNDYLGFSDAAFLKGTALSEGIPSGATGSRLLGGDYRWTHELESEVASAMGYEAALVFNSGYQLSVGLVPTLLGPGDIVFADRQIHASWVDGIQLSGARLSRFSHNDMGHLAQRLASQRALGKKALIIVESIYSMDGDSPDLEELIRLKSAFDCRLIVDEAHAFGVQGERGLGLVGGASLSASVDFLTATFGKALAGFGGIVCGSVSDKTLLVQNCRSFIFSTALPPGILIQNLTAFRHSLSADSERERLAENSRLIRTLLAAEGIETVPGESQIIPVLIGDESRALDVAARLRDRGFWTLAITHPTVPRHQARLRVSVTASHTESQCRELVAAISSIGVN